MKKRYLLAESGSTKTDWFLFNLSGQYEHYESSGMNPDIQSEQALRLSLERLPFLAHQDSIEAVFFYGAGLGSDLNIRVMQQVLGDFFSVKKIEVSHDLLAAARACCGDSPGIVCILGTGSNSCLYDGNLIVESRGGHGYLLGDEGSGADLGKTLLKLAFEGRLSKEITANLCAWEGNTLKGIRKELHQSERPNVFLAHFSEFIAKYIDSEEVSSFIARRFHTFLSHTVDLYTAKTELTVHFVGSIAVIYQPILQSVLQSRGLQLGQVIKRPANALMEYHLAKITK